MSCMLARSTRCAFFQPSGAHSPSYRQIGLSLDCLPAGQHRLVDVKYRSLFYAVSSRHNVKSSARSGNVTATGQVSAMKFRVGLEDIGHSNGYGFDIQWTVTDFLR